MSPVSVALDVGAPGRGDLGSAVVTALAFPPFVVLRRARAVVGFPGFEGVGRRRVPRGYSLFSSMQ